MILFICFLIGCKSTEQDQKKTTEESSTSESETTGEPVSVNFAINYPENNGRVDRNIITIRGVGAQGGNEIKVEVFTDTWYSQTGDFEINNDGSWTYSPCYLMGRGSYRLHHNIRAKLLKIGEVIAQHTIYEVEAPEP